MTWRSQTFSIGMPGVEDDPWYPRFTSGFEELDAAVASVTAGIYRAAHTHMVLSIYPSAAVALTATSETAGFSWSVLSCAPFGPAQGAFTVLNSGMAVQFDLLATATAVDSSTTEVPGSGQGLAATDYPTAVAWRVVLDGEPFGSVRSLNVTGDSAWVQPLARRLTFRPTLATCVVSLGRGAYRATLEWHAVKRSATTIGSAVMVSTAAYVSLLATEVVCP